MAANTEKLTLPLRLTNLRGPALGVGVGALIAAVVISMVSGDGLDLFWHGYVYGLVFLIGVCLGPFALLMIHHMTAGNWTFIIQRMLEAATRTWPLAFGAIAVLVGGHALGLHELYAGWADLDGHHANVKFHEAVVNKAFYLNTPFWLARGVFYLVAWTFLITLYNNWSKKLDQTGDQKYVVKMRFWAPLSVIFYCISTTFAFTDWFMSLEPDWFSTIYGPLFWISQGLTTFAIFILILQQLSSVKPMAKYVTVEHYYMLGTFMMAFVIIWAYMSFSQYLLIWAGNLPEEITWYIVRDTDGLNLIAVSLMMCHFFLPLMFLLQRRFKFNIWWLSKMCVWILFWRMVDVFYIINPAFHHAEGNMGVYPEDIVISVTVLAGMMGLWLWYFLGQLQKSTSMPLNDPRLYDAMHHVSPIEEAAEHA